MWEIYGNFIKLLSEFTVGKVLITDSPRAFLPHSTPAFYTVCVYKYSLYMHLYTDVQWSPWG